MNFADALKNKFSGSEGAARMQGIGLLMSQLGSGQTPNASPALQMLEDRKAQKALKAQMASGDFLTQFSPQEQAFLATLPPQAAQSLIAQRIFARPTPVTGTEINGRLVNPQTGEVMADFSDGPARDTKVVNDQLVDSNTGEVIADYRDADGITRYIASGEAAAALGLDPEKSYNIESGPDGMKASAIGGGGVNIDMGGSEVGAIPQGFELFTDPETGARRLQAIPGGPADTSGSEEEKAFASDTATEVVSNAFARANEADGQRMVGGLLGQLAAVNPGSANAEVYRQVAVLGDLAAAESLNAMRRQSATGGALGNVTERELALLSRQAGALDPASPNFQRDLQDYTRALMRTIHGGAAGDEIANSLFGATDEVSDDDLLSLYGN